jgi:hypothetical protein
MTAPQPPDVWWSPSTGLRWISTARKGLPDDAVRLIPADQVAAERDRLRAQRDAAIALLDDVIEDLADVIPYAGDYFDKKWGYSVNLAEFKRRRAALGVTGDE